MIHTEIILYRDSRRDLHFGLDVHMLLCLQRLMQTVLITSSGHKSACERVNDYNFAVLYDVVDISFLDAVSMDGLIDIVRYTCVFRVVEIFYTEKFLDLFGSARRKNGA